MVDKRKSSTRKFTASLILNVCAILFAAAISALSTLYNPEDVRPLCRAPPAPVPCP